MKICAHKGNAKKSLPDSMGESKGLGWKTKRTVHMNVDFSRIESHPETDLHFEVREKITDESSPLELLLRKEKVELCRKMIRYARNLSERQRLCLSLTLDGYTPTEIAEQLGMSSDSSVHNFVSRAVSKLQKSVKGQEHKKYF